MSSTKLHDDSGDIEALRRDLQQATQKAGELREKNRVLNAKLKKLRAELREMENSWPGKVYRATRKLRRRLTPVSVENLPDPPPELVPPPELRYGQTPEAYVKAGARCVELFANLAGLEPDYRVLEPGCGSGRIASALTQYLNRRGSYEGFDIVPERIKWCRERITPRYPNFKFTWVDLFNKTYHPEGQTPAEKFTFPYPEVSFDFVYLTSVFTHMLPADTEHYLREMRRVLKPGGRAFVTFFLLNDESMRLVQQHGADLDRKFINDEGDYFTEDRDRPEAAVAFREPFIRGVIDQCGFQIKEPVWYGNWCHRPSEIGYQDVMILQK